MTSIEKAQRASVKARQRRARERERAAEKFSGWVADERTAYEAFKLAEETGEGAEAARRKWIATWNDRRVERVVA